MIAGMTEKEFFASGHRACAGCGEALAVRHILKAAGEKTIVAMATGCMEVVSTPFPQTAWRLPWIHVAFQNAPAVVSGIDAALRAMKKRDGINLIAVGGDGACYSPDTKILTESGFKWVGEIETSDKVWSVNPSNLKLELQTVNKLHSFFYEGKMIRANTRYIDFLVTPNHNIPTQFRESKKMRFIKAEELLKRYKTLLPRSFKWNGSGQKEFVLPKIEKKTSQKEYSTFKMADWLEFIGWYVTEGCCYKSDSGYLVRIYQSNKEKRKKILMLANRMGLHANECYRSVDISSKQLFTYLKNNCGDYFYNKRIPKEFLQLSPKLLHRLFYSMIAGDGCISLSKGRTNPRTTFFTKSEFLINDFVELCLKLGKNCHIGYGANKVARIGVQEKHLNNELYSTRKFTKNKPQVIEEDYFGMVHCPELQKNHTLIIERNGKISLNGNSFDIGFAALSGALERGHKFTYIATDNEAYMNTGVQRSSATPFLTNTTTSPAGTKVHGKLEPKKPLPLIVAAHGIRYVATASVANLFDLHAKVKKALAVEGPSFLHVYNPCPVGWYHDPSQTIEIAKLALATRVFPLYEIENGVLKFNQKVEKENAKPVKEYLQTQGRFKHLSENEIEQIQKYVDERYDFLSGIEGKKSFDVLY